MVVVVLSVRVPASVGVSTAQPRLVVCVAPRPCTYLLRSRIAMHESDVVISDHHRHRHRRIDRDERWGESEACPDQQQDQHHQVARPVRTHVRRRQCPRPGVHFSMCVVEEGGGVVGEEQTEAWMDGQSITVHSPVDRPDTWSVVCTTSSSTCTNSLVSNGRVVLVVILMVNRRSL